jgi:hypothetical protein
MVLGPSVAQHEVAFDERFDEVGTNTVEKAWNELAVVVFVSQKYQTSLAPRINPFHECNLVIAFGIIALVDTHCINPQSQRFCI